MMVGVLARCSAASFLLLGLAAGCGAPGEGGESAERTSTSRSAIVGGAPSAAAEDFTVFVTVTTGDAQNKCAGTLVAPNLVVTARHCVAPVTIGVGELAKFDCLPSGEPPPGGGGFVTGAYPPSSIRVVAGVDAAGRWNLGKTLGTPIKEVLDDGSSSTCSHDIAVLLLQEPLAGVPVAKLRLHKRPAVGDRLAIAGWGEAENRIAWPDRRRRDDVVVTRIGPPRFEELGEHPRTFQSTLGACYDDSGGPVFDPTAGALTGLIARGTGFDENDPSSPCSSPGAAVSNMVVADFGDLLHRAFAKAQAEPLLESRATPGWATFGETCLLDAECGSNVCLKEAAASKCNLDCVSTACPGGFTCDVATRRCLSPQSSVITPGATTPEGEDAAPPVSAKADDCTLAAPIGTSAPSSLAAAPALLALIALARRRSRRSHRSS